MKTKLFGIADNDSSLPQVEVQFIFRGNCGLKDRGGLKDRLRRWPRSGLAHGIVAEFDA
jgi:hypothetical protein